jgi:hypothetical protein
MTQEDKEKAKTAEWPTWKGGDNMCGCGQEAQQGPYYGPLKTAARVGLYEEVGAAIGRLVDAKQKAYGRSFDRVGSILKILYPTGIKPEQYDDRTVGMLRGMVCRRQESAPGAEPVPGPGAADVSTSAIRKGGRGQNGGLFGD